MITAKKFIYRITIFCTVISGCINLYAQDLELRYNRPAEKWVEALPIGNGRLGAMIFGGVKNDRIQFNEETLWTGYPRNYNKQGAWQYLDSIRQLLFAGKQKEAEDLAGQEFMGLKSHEGDREAWIKKVTAVLQKKNNPSQTKYNDVSWKTMKVPEYNGWEAEGFEGMDGAVWFRYSFQLPDEWIGKDLKLDINKISDYDFTYINGVLVGSQNNADTRDYIIPASVLKKGENTIAIFVLNFSGKGGILGYKDRNNPISVFPAEGNTTKRLSLNGQWKYFIQDNDVPAIGQYQASYQPFGDLNFIFDIDEGRVENYERSLDIANAVATTSYIYNDTAYKREYLASAPDQVLAFHFTSNKKAAINFAVLLSGPHKASVIKRIDACTIALHVKVKDGVLKGSAFLQLRAAGGSVAVQGNKIIVKGADEVTTYLTANTNYKNFKDISADPVQLGLATLSKVKTKTFRQIIAAHIKEYQSYFNTFSISFGRNNMQKIKWTTDKRLNNFGLKADDPAFVALYVQYSRYLLISSSRPGTRPANLQGIWNDLLAPPWGSKYTTNINLEMNYWPADLLNLSPMQQPLFQMIRELSVAGAKTAKQYYNAPGWVLHHNTDLWRGTAPINASDHGIWVTGGAWLCDHLWQHYLFTKDEKFLAETAYPIMKNAALFFNSFLIKDPATGYLISTPSNSPEQGGLVAGPAMDHQIIRNLFRTVVQAGEILNTDKDLREMLKIKYAQIAPDKIGRFGQLQEWMQDVDDTTNKHRHVSHLWAVYPGSEINWEHSADLMKAARQSLIYRGDEATGWSLAWKINLWARFKDGNRTYKLIQMLLSPVKEGAGSYPNLFDAHPPFQIDGNFGGAAGVGELLLQSHLDDVELLPALPDALPEGSVHGIRARGGFLLDINWEKGILQSVTVKSTAGMPLRLRYHNKTITIQTVKNGIYKFNGSLQQL